MKTIHKFRVKITDQQVIEMDPDGKILGLLVQGSIVYLWALVNPKAPKVARKFIIYGTGHPIPDNVELTYLGTVQQDEYVWHLFEDTKV